MLEYVFSGPERPVCPPTLPAFRGRRRSLQQAPAPTSSRPKSCEPRARTPGLGFLQPSVPAVAPPHKRPSSARAGRFRTSDRAGSATPETRDSNQRGSVDSVEETGTSLENTHVTKKHWLADRPNNFCISADLMMLALQYLPVSCVLPFRRVGASFYNCAQLFLSRDPDFKAALTAHMTQLIHRTDQRVWVAVRARPYYDRDGCCDIYRNRVTLAAQRVGQNDTHFFFDAAFHWTATQNDVWSHLGPNLMRCLCRREHACLLAYGQTGSGKTHTMFGDPCFRESEGLIFRVARSLGAMLRAWDESEPQPVVEISFLEVYNEKVYDLFANGCSCDVVSHREVLDSGDKYHAPTYAAEERAVPVGLTRRRCEPNNFQRALGWILEGCFARTSGQTVLNQRSSRSHAVVTLHILWGHQTSDGGSATKETRLYLVDLAGSERAGQYARNLEQLKEGVNINRSLSTLARVVGSLARGQGDHVPHRDSILTWLLHDAITGRSARAFMIATIHPEHPAETLSTLCYAREYSALRSSLGSRIPKLLADVRRLRGRLAGIHNEFDRACEDFSKRCRGGATWTAQSLQEERMVRAKHGAPKEFRGHSHLIWTDTHWGKRSIGAVGVVQAVEAPEPRLQGEAKDGRRRHFRSQQGAVVDRAVKVSYAGRHGWPAVELWYPEEALADVLPPAELLELVRRAERIEDQLQCKQRQLQEAQEQFVAEQQQWMSEAA